MSARRVDGFFYGLFMDPEVLRQAGVQAAAPRMAYVDGLALRIGQRATLLPQPGARAYGMLYALTHDELDALYGAPGLESYVPEAVTAQTTDAGSVAALCYNLLEAPAPDEANAEYAARLREALSRLGFPDDYIAAVR